MVKDAHIQYNTFAVTTDSSSNISFPNACFQFHFLKSCFSTAEQRQKDQSGLQLHSFMMHFSWEIICAFKEIWIFIMLMHTE
jgi:hypothetical protein